jgi:hypothetical protein
MPQAGSGAKQGIVFSIAGISFRKRGTRQIRQTTSVFTESAFEL